jgi:hypothetical protein
MRKARDNTGNSFLFPSNLPGKGPVLRCYSGSFRSLVMQNNKQFCLAYDPVPYRTRAVRRALGPLSLGSLQVGAG